MPEVSLEVLPAKDADHAEWNAFAAARGVRHHAYAWAWREILPAAFGHKPYYLIAWRKPAGGHEREVAGILPLFCVNSILFGKALISVPYLNAGGILAESEQAAAALIENAEALGKDLHVSYIELRQQEILAAAEGSLQRKSHKVSMVLDVPANPEELFASFPPKLRSQIRRPTKSGMYAQISRSSREEHAAVNGFYAVFAEHMRDLGTPVYPRRLFLLTQRCFGEACRIVTVWFEEKPVAAGLTVGFNGSTEILWASALRRYGKHSPNMLLYWEAIKGACADGYARFDFGRSSRDSNTYRFKEQWGPRPVDLHWYYHVFSGDVPDVNPNNPKFTFFVECWKHLPLTLANRLGPWLARALP